MSAFAWGAFRNMLHNVVDAAASRVPIAHFWEVWSPERSATIEGNNWFTLDLYFILDWYAQNLNFSKVRTDTKQFTKLPSWKRTRAGCRPPTPTILTSRGTSAVLPIGSHACPSRRLHCIVKVETDSSEGYASFPPMIVQENTRLRCKRTGHTGAIWSLMNLKSAIGMRIPWSGTGSEKIVLSKSFRTKHRFKTK